MSAEPTKPDDPQEEKPNNATKQHDVRNDSKALEHQAELKRLIEETRKSISNSQDLIQQIKQERGV